MMTFLEACRAWKAVTGDLPVDVSLVLEGEEENGSESLPEVLRAHRKALKADHCFICDTGQWDRDTPAISISLRGMFHEEIVVRTATTDLHSGRFGGAANNAIRVLSRIVADLHAPDGSIAIPGFYDGIEDISPAMRTAWRRLGLTPKKLLGQIGRASCRERV